jgi:hypothetical protein
MFFRFFISNLVFACVALHGAHKEQEEMVTKRYRVFDFSSIESNLSECIINPTMSSSRVVVETSKELIKYFSIKIVNGKLSLKMKKKNHSTLKKVFCIVGFAQQNMIELLGKCHYKFVPFEIPRFKLVARDHAKVSLKIDTQHLTIEGFENTKITATNENYDKGKAILKKQIIYLTDDAQYTANRLLSELLVAQTLDQSKIQFCSALNAQLQAYGKSEQHICLLGTNKRKGTNLDCTMVDNATIDAFGIVGTITSKQKNHGQLIQNKLFERKANLSQLPSFQRNVTDQKEITLKNQ